MSESQNQPHPAEGQLWRNRASERTVRITSIDPPAAGPWQPDTLPSSCRYSTVRTIGA